MELFIKEETLNSIANAINEYGVGYASGPVSQFVNKIQNMGGPILYGHYTIFGTGWLCDSTEEDITLNIQTSGTVKLYLNDQQAQNLTSITLGYSTLKLVGNKTFSFNANTGEWVGGTPRELVFAEPIEVPKKFYERFQHIVNNELPSYLSTIDQESAILDGTITAFYGAPSTIKNYAFQYCYSLSKVVLPNALAIGDFAFLSCSELTYLEAPRVSQLGSRPFSNCRNLKTVILGSSCQVIPASCFLNTQVTSVPGSPMLIQNAAFQSCTGLKSYATTNALSIEAYAFRGAKNLSYLSIKNCSSIGMYAFAQTGLYSFTCPDKLLVVPYGLLASCSSLSQVVINPSCQQIGSFAFANCSNLAIIDLTKVTNRIVSLASSDAFQGCTNLSKIRVPSQFITSYRNATNWQQFEDLIRG